LKTSILEQSPLEAGTLARNTFSGLPRRPEHSELRVMSLETFSKGSQHDTLSSLSGSLHGGEDQTPYPFNEWFQGQQTAPMRKSTPIVFVPDPMAGILSAFYSVPAKYHYDLFNDFKEAAEARDLRRLLDTISDWAATAELYADKHLAQEVQQAIGERREAAEWRRG
jgi:hypothetical protein